jgi:hypothetical protein
MANITPARKLFDLLVSKDFDPQLLDSQGKPSPDPTKAEIFSFNFRAESGKDYGTIVIMLGDDNDLEVYCADNVGKTMEGQDKEEWFAFLHQLKHFSVQNFMNFGIKNLNRLRYSMQGQAAIKEGIFESWSGTKTTSWNGNQTEARLMIRHKKTIGEGDARFRYVESLFVETAEGERYKLPFTKLTGGRAMLEHVRQGGKPYDIRGQHITGIVEEINVLSSFRRANQGQLFEGDTAELINEAKMYQETLQKNLKTLGTKNGYSKYFESWKPEDISEQDVVIESLKSLFVKQSIDKRIESALPLLAKIQQQGNAMKEANIFEAWAERLVEGTWQLPDTPEKQNKLVELLSTDLPVGADATNATEQLYDLIGDDQLFDQLEELANRDANADARQVVLNRLEELSDDPDIRTVIDSLNIDATAEMNPPEPTNPADLEPQEPVQETEDPAGTSESAYPEYAEDLSAILNIAGVPAKERPAPDYEEELLENLSEGAMKDIDIARQDCKSMTDKEFIKAYGQTKEQWRAKHKDLIKENVLNDDTGETIDHILNRFKHEVKKFELNGDLDDDLYHALFDYYFDQGEIPYGIAKARDGDPYDWVAANLESHLPGGGIVGGNPDEDYGIERESVMHGDYAEEKSRMLELAGLPQETDEGVLGTVGGAMGGGMLGTLAGGAIGGALGGPAGSALGATAGGEIGRVAGAVGGQELTKGGSSLIEKEVDEETPGDMISGALSLNPITSVIKGASNTAGKIAGIPAVAGKAFDAGKNSMTSEDEVDEGWKGQLAGGALGSMAGEIAGTPLGPLGMMAGGALGGSAGAMIGDKIDGPDEEEQLNEFIGPAIAAGARAIVPLLSKIGPALGRLVSQGGQAVGQAAKSAAPVVGQAAKQGAQAVGQVAKQGAEVVAKNAGQIGMGVGAYQAITDTAKSLVGGVGEVYHDIGGATEAITKMVGNSLDSFSIKSLADAAVKYAIPIGILLAVLYGGKKLIDGIFSESLEVTDEGIIDSIKGLAGIKNSEPAPNHIPKTIADLSKILDTPNSPVAAGFSNSMIEDSKEETSPLAGQYGHSGKMQEVGKDTSFLDRLKELSGLKK